MPESGDSIIGVIYKTAGTRSFVAALSREDVNRGDYIVVEHPRVGPVLGQIAEVEEVSSLSYDQAQSIRLGGDVKFSKKLSGQVDVIGYRDEDGLVQTPRTPFSPGATIQLAEDNLIEEVLGLTKEVETGAYIGLLEGHELKVRLDINTLVQKHISVIAKTGSGKSYLVGVLLEEFIKKRIPAVVIDPHGEYTSLLYPNSDPEEQPRMKRFGIKPKGYSKHILEYTINKDDNPGAMELTLDGLGLSPDDIFDLSGVKPAGMQAGMVYRAIDGLKRLGKDYYSIDDVIFALERDKNPIKWNVINSLEHIKTLNIFADKPTKLKALVKPGMVSLVNLRGAPEDLVNVFVTQFMKRIFHARKTGRIPPLMLFVEEAHNFCPQMSKTLSNKVFRTVASEGRKFGLGVCVVTQRPAKVDKNVLSQCNTQVIFKVTNPNDLKAISASMEGMTSSMQDDIQRLPISHAIVVGGWITRPITIAVRIRESKHGGKGADVFNETEEEEEEEYDQDFI
jgi:DNA helicase HerA-like ATPase